MRFSEALHAVVAVLRRRPSDVLPPYLLGVAVPTIARVVPFLAAAVAYVYLETTGRLASIEAQVADVEMEMPDPEANPDAFAEWLLQFEPVYEQVWTPPMAALVLVAIVGFVAVFVVLTALVAAAQLAACDARLRDERGMVAAVAGLRRYGLRFLGLFLLEAVLTLVVVGAVAIPTALVAIAVGVAMTPVAVLVVLLGVLVAILALAVVRALFAFAPVAVVVDDAGVFGSLSNAVGFVRARPVDAGFYYVVSVGTLLATSVVSGLLMLVEVVMAVSLVTALVVLPALDLLKTTLYGDYRGRIRPPASPDRSLAAQVRRGVRRGLRELVAFVRRTPGTHALVIVLGVVSFLAGWHVADPFVGVVPASISARLEGHVPPAAAVEFFGNNWLVAITTAYAGVAFVLPAIVSVLFNGVYFGATARLEVEPLELLAFVVPHGVIEIPAIVVASALGIRLGVVGWRTVRGRLDGEAFADALERAFWVLVGIGVLLAVAGFVEGFVSPYYWRPFL